MYINVTPPKNDGKTAYRLTTVRGEVPVDGFWSVIVYDAEGYIPANDRGVYSLQRVSPLSERPTGSVSRSVRRRRSAAANCVPIVPGWSYTVRLYRPRPEVLSGQWKFPEAVLVE